MAEVTKVRSFVDLESTGSERDAFLKQVDDVLAKIASIKPAQIKLINAGDSKEAAKALTDLVNKQQALSKSEKEYQRTLNDTLKAEKISAQVKKDLANATALEAKANKDNTAAKVNEAKASKETANAELLEAKASSEVTKNKILEAKYTAELQKQKDKLDKASLKEINNQARLQSAYEQLKFKYTQAANTAKNLGAELGIQSQEFLDASKQAQLYYQQLVGIEDAVGQSQRKVGQYTNATFALSQLLREAPSFAFSFQTGLLGISNNIPILVDQIQALNKVTGNGFKSFSILAKSLFSVNNLLTIGVAVLTIFGPKIFDAFSATKKLNEAQKELLDTEKQLNDVFKERISTTPVGIENFGKDAQRSIDVIEKQGATQAQLFALRKKQASDELFFQNDILRVTTARAEQEDVNTEKGIRGIKALQNAREHYDILIQSNLIKQQILLQDIAEAEKNDKSTKSLKSDLEVVTAALSNAKAGAEVYQKALEGSADAQAKFNNIVAEESKFNLDERRKILLESASIEVDSVQKKNALILSNERSTLGQRLEALRSNLAAEQRLIAAQETNVLNDPTASDADKLIARKKAFAEFVKAELEYQSTVVKLKDDYRLKDLEATKNEYVLERQLQSDLNKDLIDNLQLNLSQRLAALKRYSEAQKDIAKANYILSLQQAGLSDKDIQAFIANNDYKVLSKKITDAELINLAKDYENEVLRLGIDTNKQITQSLADEITRQKAIREDDVAFIKELYDGLYLSRYDAYAQDVINLNNSLKAGEISLKKYNENRKKLDNKYQKQVQLQTIEEIRDQLTKYTGLEDERTKIQQEAAKARQDFANARTDAEKADAAARIVALKKELDEVQDDINKKIELEKKLRDATIAASDDSTQKQIENQQKLRDAEKTLISAAQDTISAIFDGRYTRESNRIQATIDKLEEKRQIDIDIANQTATTAQDAANRITIINARADAQRTQLERKQRQIEQERAKFAKAVEIAQIIGQTAVGVINALSGPPPAPPNPALAAVIGAIGALNLAKVIATPLPKYAEGLEYAEQGHFGIMGDGGRRERLIYSSGATWTSPNQSTVVWIPKGSQIDPDADQRTAFKAMSPAAAGPGLQQDNDMSGVLIREMKLTRKAIISKKENHWKVVNGQISLTTKEGYNEVNYLNQNLNS